MPTKINSDQARTVRLANGRPADHLVRTSPSRLRTSAALILALLVVAAPVPSRADITGANPGTSPLSAEPTRMWQTDNVVYALAYSRGVLYVGGTFSAVRPPDAEVGTEEVPQARLAAFDAATGALVSTWRPTVAGGDVLSLEISPDGTRLYAGGSFDSIDGHARANIAAFNIADPRSPRLLRPRDFRAGTNGRVTALSATSAALFVGGRFTKAGEVVRRYVAAFAADGSGLTSFKPRLSGVSARDYAEPFVTSVAARGGRVAIGGLFDYVNGLAQHGLAMVASETGASVPGFRPPPIVSSSYVTAIVHRRDRVFVAGRDDKTGNPLRLEGAMALDAATGAVLWGGDDDRCLGDSFDLLPLAGSLFVATHAHNCLPVGSFPESAPRFYGSVLGADLYTGEQVHFYPSVSGSPAVAGSQNNTRAFATDGRRLFVGGGFLRVNGIPQQNLFVYEPKTDGGRAPIRVVRPTAEATPTGGARVSWITTSDTDDRSLTYQVFRRNGTTPLATITAESTFWSKRTLSYVDRGVTAGESVFYKVKVTDGTNSSQSLASNTVTIASGRH